MLEENCHYLSIDPTHAPDKEGRIPPRLERAGHPAPVLVNKWTEMAAIPGSMYRDGRIEQANVFERFGQLILARESVHEAHNELSPTRTRAPVKKSRSLLKLSSKRLRTS